MQTDGVDARSSASTVRTRRRSRTEVVAKRTLDIVVSAGGLVVGAPLLLLIALIVVLDSGTPVLFRWNVVGERGRPFVGYKFRTMVPEAERLETQLSASNEMKGPAFKMKGDPRVTRCGRLLRRYSLDELPQLYSVLRGDMSLVGPRPPRIHEYERMTPWQRQKLLVKPGITCLWQVSGRSRITSFDDWVRLDLDYIEHWSLWLDFVILLKTIPAVVTARGAL